MSKETEIKSILFDLGNVIVKLEPQKLEEGYKKYCKKNPEKIIRHCLASETLRKYQEGKISSSQFYSKLKRFFRMDIKYGEFYDIWNSMFSLMRTIFFYLKFFRVLILSIYQNFVIFSPFIVFFHTFGTKESKKCAFFSSSCHRCNVIL